MSHIDPKDNKILKLEKENEKLKRELTKFSKDHFGLLWLDVPEGFEDDVENKLPILEEVPKLAIKSKDDKPTHILIEGDNYHALTCLNYTHKGKISCIYIDPPYNTGSDGFRYKDKRILDKYPDGTEVPIDHPLRHSYWLSFMKKRLELSRYLLKENGVIFISIDDNELAQLKLLCDEVFTPKNFVANLIWRKKRGGGRGNSLVIPQTEYILTYAKNIEKLKPFKKELSDYKLDNFKYEDDWGRYAREGLDHHSPQGAYERKTLQYVLIIDNKKIYCPTGQWLWSKERVGEELKNCKENKAGEKEYKYLGIVKDKNGRWRAFKKIRLDDDGEDRDETILSFIDSPKITNNSSAFEIKEIFGSAKFSYAKPSSLIKYLIKPLGLKDGIVLDFFAGSGTTGQAIMELNEDGEKRQFILITNNDEVVNGERHKIMTDICYPRIKNVIKGYDNTKGLGNSIKFYKTAFVGKNSILNADDRDKIELAHNAGAMLAIAENTLDEVEKNDYFQLFESDKQYTAVYFREEFDKFDKFEAKIRELKKPVVAYIFSWEKELDFNGFEDDKNINVKTIPQPILEIYKQIYNLA